MGTLEEIIRLAVIDNDGRTYMPMYDYAGEIAAYGTVEDALAAYANSIDTGNDDG